MNLLSSELNSDFSFQGLIEELHRLVSGTISVNVNLAKLSRWKVGGIARCIIEPSSINELKKLIIFFNKRKVHYIVIGETSNILFSDFGLKVPCIKIGTKLSGIEKKNNIVNVESGVWIPKLARTLMNMGLSGAEHICGIPGTFGGLIYMNGGSNRQSISESVITVTSITPKGDICIRKVDNCKFSYRNSIFQYSDDIIVSAELKFDHKDKKLIRNDMLSILHTRKNKFPNKLPNCGSVFKSNPSMYEKVGAPGKIIEVLGFKGHCVGDAIISPLHANFIVNNGKASSSDIVALINLVKDSVLINTGYDMEVEIKFLSSNGYFKCPSKVVDGD